jgi:hypothetical protein
LTKVVAVGGIGITDELEMIFDRREG